MLHASASRSSGRAAGLRPMAGADNALTAVVYRSRAVQPLSGTELHWLTQVAQARNREEGISGLIVYQNDCFYQWLEGPRDSVARVMGSIRNDPRHTDLIVLEHRQVAARLFTGWSMKLAVSAAVAAPFQDDVIEVPVSVMCNLGDHPDFAPSILMKMSPLGQRGADFGDIAARVATSSGLPPPILRDAIRATIIPRLLHGYASQSLTNGRLASRAEELARLLMVADPECVTKFLHDLRARGASDSVITALVEPTARVLGDFWLEDWCSEFDLTVSLGRLQNAVRLACGNGQRTSISTVPAPSVLITPEPGERHFLGAAIDSDSLSKAGWSPRCAFPATDAALEILVHESWFDALDLSLSLALRRDHWLPRVAATIVKARRASRNPAMVVIVAGRIFSEVGGASAQVGADFTRRSPGHVDELILHGLNTLH